MDNPVRSKKPDSTINGNKDGIICLYQVVSPVFTSEMLLTGLVNNNMINKRHVINGRYFVTTVIFRYFKVILKFLKETNYFIIRNGNRLKNRVEKIG